MSKKRLAVPEARKALDQFKVELANEFGVNDPSYLASSHTGKITRRLVETAERQLIDQYNKQK